VQIDVLCFYACSKHRERCVLHTVDLKGTKRYSDSRMLNVRSDAWFDGITAVNACVQCHFYFGAEHQSKAKQPRTFCSERADSLINPILDCALTLHSTQYRVQTGGIFQVNRLKSFRHHSSNVARRARRRRGVAPLLPETMFAPALELRILDFDKVLYLNVRVSFVNICIARLYPFLLDKTFEVNT